MSNSATRSGRRPGAGIVLPFIVVFAAVTLSSLKNGRICNRMAINLINSIGNDMSDQDPRPDGAEEKATDRPETSGMPVDVEQDAQLAGRVRESARQIWLAGLGAYTKAEEDAGRFFDRLVHEGEELENKTRGLVEKQLKTVEHKVEDVRERATGTWDRLETLFDQRVSGALRRLGIHRREEIEVLEQRLAALEEEVRVLKAQSDPSRATGGDEEE